MKIAIKNYNEKINSFADNEFVYAHFSLRWVSNFRNYFANLSNLKICHSRIFFVFLDIDSNQHQISKICNFGNLNFFVFLNELAYSVTFEATLQISEIYNNFQVFFSENFFYFHFDEICAKITLKINFKRSCSLGDSKLLQTWIF